jgi:peptidyl-tRNA hydrolase
MNRNNKLLNMNRREIEEIKDDLNKNIITKTIAADPKDNTKTKKTYSTTEYLVMEALVIELLFWALSVLNGILTIVLIPLNKDLMAKPKVDTGKAVTLTEQKKVIEVTGADFTSKQIMGLAKTNKTNQSAKFVQNVAEKVICGLVIGKDAYDISTIKATEILLHSIPFIVLQSYRSHWGLKTRGKIASERVSGLVTSNNTIINVKTAYEIASVSIVGDIISTIVHNCVGDIISCLSNMNNYLTASYLLQEESYEDAIFNIMDFVINVSRKNAFLAREYGMDRAEVKAARKLLDHLYKWGDDEGKRLVADSYVALSHQYAISDEAKRENLKEVKWAALGITDIPSENETSIAIGPNASLMYSKSSDGYDKKVEQLADSSRRVSRNRSADIVHTIPVDLTRSKISLLLQEVIGKLHLVDSLVITSNTVQYFESLDGILEFSRVSVLQQIEDLLGVFEEIDICRSETFDIHFGITPKLRKSWIEKGKEEAYDILGSKSYMDKIQEAASAYRNNADGDSIVKAADKSKETKAGENIKESKS